MEKDRIITNLDLLWYFVNILIIYTETSNLSPSLKMERTRRLQALRSELGLYYD